MKAFMTLAAILFAIGCCIFGVVACTTKVSIPVHGQRIVRFTRAIEWKETIIPERTSEVLSSKHIDTTICITVVNRECNNDNTLGNVRYTYWGDENSEIEYANNRISAYTIFTSDTTGVTYSRVIK